MCVVMCAQIEPADSVVERMLTLMTSQEPGYWHLNINPGRLHIMTVPVSTSLVAGSYHRLLYMSNSNTCDEEITWKLNKAIDMLVVINDVIRHHLHRHACGVGGQQSWWYLQHGSLHYGKCSHQAPR